MKYVEYRQKINKLHSKLERPPFYRSFRIDDSGGLAMDETYLTPEEALKLGEWLVSFYKGADR